MIRMVIPLNTQNYLISKSVDDKDNRDLDTDLPPENRTPQPNQTQEPETDPTP